MRSSLLFTTYPILETPASCSVCSESLPIFHYEFQSEDGKGEPYQLEGFCCEPCARRFLKALECTESQQWAEEEQGLSEQDQDTVEFHKRLESLRSVLVG